MNKQSVVLPGPSRKWGSYISKYQPDSSDVLDNMFTANSKNFITDQTGMIDKRQGGVQWNRTNFGNVAKDTYEAVFESGARHFLRVGGGILSASTGTGLFDVITSGYSLLGNFEWVTYQDRSYGDNGVNAPQVYDIATSYGGVTYSFTTAKTKTMGAQAPLTAPTSGAYTAGGAVPVGSHRYKVTFMYYDSEESNGSPASAIQTATGGTQTGHLSAIPVGGYGVTARNIYRDNNDGVYLLLDTIPNNTTTTYTDTLLIGSTPTPMPLTNDVPPTFSKAALWLDSIFIAPSGETNTVRYSNTGSPDVFDPDNFIVCQSDDVITALYVYNGKLYVFGLHSFGSIEGNTPDTFYYHNISNLIGCVDNRSIQVRSIVSVPTLWWLSDKGFYYSNGNTVEYGSDFIQDLVNLNLAQVNYSANKNTQSSFADFSGDTRSPGIDIDVNPGAINTINPTETFSSRADWEGGSVSQNIKTTDGNFAEVPTLFSPLLPAGTVSGNAYVNGSVVNLTFGTPFTGVDNSAAALISPAFFVPHGNLFEAQAVTFPIAGTLNTVNWDVSGSAGTETGQFFIDSSIGGANLYTGSAIPLVPGGQRRIETVNIAVTAGQTVYFIKKYNPVDGDRIVGSASFVFGNGIQPAFSASRGSGYSAISTVSSGNYAYTFTQSPVPSPGGTWTSPVYDTGVLNLTGTGLNITLTGTYPSSTSVSVAVQGSTNGTSFTTTDTLSSPTGTVSLTGGVYRYWRIVYSLASTNNQITPSITAPVLRFNITGTWVSQPIDATSDNTGWGTLTYTGNIPLGTTATVTIATAATEFGIYSAFTAIGSAIVQPWAKVRLVITADALDGTSPSISSVTLTWNITATIESTPIDTGTTPAGFSTIQWEQTNATGTVTFYLRTATTAPGLSAATYVAVLNGDFPNLSALEFVQWKLILTASADNTPEITSVTVNWFISSGAAGVRVASIFFNKTYYISVATTGSTANNTLIQLDQFGNWRIQKDASIGTFLSYFNTLYFTDGITDKIFNGFIADTDDGVAIAMDVRTKAWSADNDLFLKVPRAFKVTGLNTGTTIRAYYSNDRGATWIEMLNEQGNTGFVTNTSKTEFVVLFVPNGDTLISGRTLMFRIVSDDVFPCSIMNYVPSFYSRKGRYLSNG